MPSLVTCLTRVIKNRLSTVFIALLVAGLADRAEAADLIASVKDTSDKPVANAVVVVHALANKTPLPASAAAVVIDQIDKEFVPMVKPILVGTAVHFPNKDNIRHHVYSFSDTKTFELQFYTGTPSKPIVFDKPGVAILGCNIHDWMRGYLYVVDTPYFGKTDADGKLTIAGLPPGRYTAKVWHYRMKQKEETTVQTLNVAKAVNVESSWTLQLRSDFRPPRPHIDSPYYNSE
jgi:plastocyanin